VDADLKVLTDGQLVTLCLGGDGRAWETLILRYKRLIYSIPVKFHFSPSDCSDVFQAVCLKLIEHLQSLKDENRVSAWLITTTTRQCIHFRRRQFREFTPEEELEEPPDAEPNVEEMQVEVEANQRVRDAVETLPERCRQLITLLYFEAGNPSYEEISQALQIPVASIGPTRARCLDKLRVTFRRKGFQ
jgi:RNA polymerase sigma factor (sigma-70 family)